METVFDKPLDKKVASLNDHIATISAYSTGSFQISHSNITSAERALTRKLGRLVIVDLTFIVGTTISADEAELFKGLPEAQNATRFRIPHSYDATKPPLTLIITTSGKINNQWSNGGVSTGQWAGQFCYIAKE